MGDTGKPYMWLTKEGTKNDKDLSRSGTKPRTPGNRGGFGEVAFVMKSAPAFFRNYHTTPKSISPEMPIHQEERVDEKHLGIKDDPALPDVVDLSLSSDDEWMDKKDELKDEVKEVAQKCDVSNQPPEPIDLLLQSAEKFTPTNELNISNGVTASDAEIDTKKPVIHDTAKDDCDLDDGWNDLRTVSNDDKTLPNSPQTIIKSESRAIVSFDPDMHCNDTTPASATHNISPIACKFEIFDDSAFPRVTTKEEPQANANKTSNGPIIDAQGDTTFGYPLYLDMTMDEDSAPIASNAINPLSQSDTSVVNSLPQNISSLHKSISDDDDGWDDFRLNNEKSSTNLPTEKGTITPVQQLNREKYTFDSVEMECVPRTRNGLESFGNRMHRSVSASRCPTRLIRTKDNTGIRFRKVPADLVTKNQDVWNTAYSPSAFMSKASAIPSNANDLWSSARNGKYEFEWKTLDPSPKAFANVLKLPSPERPEKRIARESIRGFEKILKSNKAENTRHEDQLAEKAKQKLRERSNKLEFVVRPFETSTPKKSSMFDSIISKPSPSNRPSSARKLMDIDLGLNSSRRSEPSINLVGKRATDERHDNSATNSDNRCKHIIDCARRLFKQKEIREFVRMSDQQTYLELVEELALL